MISLLNRKAKLSYAIICILCVCFCAACNQKVKNSDNGVSFDTIQSNQTYPSNDSATLRCNLEISFAYPQSSKEAGKLKNLQEIFIEKVFTQKYVGLSPREAVDSFSIHYIDNFKVLEHEILSGKPLQDEDLDDDDFVANDDTGFTYYLNLKNKIVYNNNNLLSFTVETENYEGGAHGSHGIYGYVIDLNTGELLTEEAFAGNNFKKNLSSVLVQKIVSAKGLDDVKQLENIGYNQIENIVPNGNFTIDDKGITYYFNEYDIASYFVGITKVFIPYSELKVFITGENPLTPLAGI
jgi:hypothetical protein